MAGDGGDLSSRRSPRRNGSGAFSSIGQGDADTPAGSVNGWDHGEQSTTETVVKDERRPSQVSRNNYRRAAGASYVLAVGVCGIVLIALASSLMDLAELVNRSSIEVCIECCDVRISWSLYNSCKRLDLDSFSFESLRVGRCWRKQLLVLQRL